MTEINTSYGNIFKTTFLFGLVQVFKAVISIMVNKLAAMLIGPNGMGLLGIYNSTISLIQTGAGLGLNQSAVRDVAEANSSGDTSRRNRVINVTLKAVLFTGLLGLIITISLSYFISEWTLGDYSYTASYCVLAFVICLNIINDGRQAVLKGMRLMRYLAYASIIGTSTSLFISIPLYYMFGINGIVPALLLSSIFALIVSNYYISKNKVAKEIVTLGDLRIEAMPMVKIGTVLMFVTFLQTIVAFCINSFVRNEGGIEDVGFYSTGRYILSGYFGLVITALMTDYYPRIAAVSSDNKKLSQELNKQMLVTLVLCCPMIVIFVAFLPSIIKLLYTEEFIPVVGYVRFAIFGTIIMSFSNPLDMILVVKQNVKFLLILSTLVRLFQLLVCYALYIHFGLIGLGIASVLVTALHCTLVYSIAYKRYNIKISLGNCIVIVVVFVLSIGAILSNSIHNIIVRTIIVLSIGLISLVFSYGVLKRQMGISMFTYIKNKIHL